MSGYQIMIICIVISLGTTVRTNLREEHRKNMKASLNLRCAPKPRSFPTIIALRNQNNTQLSTNYYITPAYYVLHVCDQQSGCCHNEDQQCRVKYEEEVTFVFKLTDIKSKDSEYTQINATNHTQCQCSVEPIKRFPHEQHILASSAVKKNYVNNLLIKAAFLWLIIIWNA